MKGTLGTKKSITESWTGVAMQLALLLQVGSHTVINPVFTLNVHHQIFLMDSDTLANFVLKTVEIKIKERGPPEKIHLKLIFSYSDFIYKFLHN